MRGCRQLRGASKRGVWRTVRETDSMGRFARDIRFCVASLWRFQWLQRYRARQRSIDGFSFHGQFPAAVSFATLAGILAPVAHQLEHLVAGLSLYPASRQRGGEVENFHEPDPDH